MKKSLEASLFDTGNIIRRGYSFLLENAGKTIAIITGFVVTLVTFTEIGFMDFVAESYTTTLITMLISAYIIYFSLEDAGEKLGRESEEYLSSEKRYKEARERLIVEDISELRDFLSSYCENELSYRRRCYLFSNGISLSQYEEFIESGTAPKDIMKICKRAKRMKASSITPKQLLSKDRSAKSTELSNPEMRKLLRLILKLIPSTVCMIFTVSLMLGAKDGMTPEFIIESILKLSALPIIGLRGYAEGYRYARSELPIWLDTKTQLMSGFLKT